MWELASLTGQLLNSKIADFGYIRPCLHAIDNHLNGFCHAVTINFVDINGVSNGGEHCDGELSPEVLTEFFEPVKQFIGLPQRRMIAEEPQSFERQQDTIGVGGGKSMHQAGVHSVDRNTDCHSFTVPQFKVTHCLELMSRPMTVIQWSRFEHFKGITTSSNVPQMPLSGFFNHWPACCAAGGNGFGITQNASKKIGILKQRDFHRF
jgi:hypothetical protein